MCDGAIRYGHLDILKFAYETGHQLNIDMFDCKHIHILSWLFDNNRIQPNIKISEMVAKAGNLECLQFLYSKNFPILSGCVFANAVSGRNVEMIQWLYDLGCPFERSSFEKEIGDEQNLLIIDRSAANAAVRQGFNSIKTSGGSLPILKMLVEWGCILDNYLCNITAYYDDLEILKYLYANGCTLNKKVISNAAYNGHLHIIIWAREHGCEWDSVVCGNTVLWNHLNVLRWLRGFDRDICELRSNETEICPWDENVCLQAIHCGHIDILKFALENGCECSDKCYEAVLDVQNDIITLYMSDYHNFQIFLRKK